MSGKTIRELETTFEQLHERLVRAEISEGEFQAKVRRLRFEDDQGRQWRIGWYTGKWYRCDQDWWSPDTPPKPEADQASLAALPAWAAKGKRRRAIIAWLVAPLVLLLLLGSILAVTDWATAEWGVSSAPSVQLTRTSGGDAISSLASPTLEPTHAPASPTLPPPSRTPGHEITRQVPTSGQADVSAPTHTPYTAAEAGRSAAEKTPAPTNTPIPASAKPSPTAGATASPIPSPSEPAPPMPSPKPQQASFSGQVFFPVYDPQPARRTFDIYAVQLDSGERQLVAGQASQPAISPDGQRLAYRSWEPGLQGLSVLELAEGRTWRWVDSALAARPSWSPDSQNVVFPSQQEFDRLWRIYQTLGLDFVQIRRHDGDLLGRVPAWLADGRIVYWDCPLANCGLYIMQGDGANPVRLTTAEHDTGPAASPDGQRVAFTSNRDGNWDIYLVDSHAPPGTEPMRLTQHAARDGLPTWSPNGKWLAFASDRGGTWAVWVMRPDGSKLQKLFDLGGTLEGEAVYAQAGAQGDWTFETIAWGPQVPGQ